jgi:hypothetical protein
MINMVQPRGKRGRIKKYIDVVEHLTVFGHIVLTSCQIRHEFDG